jgi:plasmid stabilization system protein ParE
LLRPPTLGAPARALPLHRVRRVLMRRTRSYIYYRVFRETLEVLAVWHASRDREPAV